MKMGKNRLILLLKIVVVFLSVLIAFLLIWNPVKKNYNLQIVGLMLAGTLPPIALLFRKSEIKKYSFGLIVILIGIIIYFVI